MPKVLNTRNLSVVAYKHVPYLCLRRKVAQVTGD